MRSKGSPFVRLAVEADLSVFVQAYTNTRRNNIRIRFDEGGFIPDGVFRYVMRAMRNPSIIPDDDAKTVKLGNGKIKFLRGPVRVTASSKQGLVDGHKVLDVTMEVVIRLPDGSGDVSKTIDPDTCDEIDRRLRQVDAMLDTYFDKEDEVEDERYRRGASKGNGTNGASRPAAAAPRSP
ncbi:MAG: hypothetical protein RL272_776 [Candidatus Parcubacteria bacterium]|jgi:hypothetical protein